MLRKGQLRFQKKFGKTDHPIQGSPDFVAHIRQKLAFRLAGLQGQFLRFLLGCDIGHNR